MREDNDRMLRLLCIHEGVPGHYLQLAWSNRSPSLVRTIFSDGMFAEGWAVYVEQVMMDLGYGADDPALMLTHWKMTLRAITNAILDVETHTRGMTEEAAIDLMVRQAFQEEDEARAKWLRARLTSTQLSTYYVGGVEMFDLEVEARQRAAVAAGGRGGRPATAGRSVVSVRHPASTTARTWNRSSRTARRRSAGSAASSPARRRSVVPGRQACRPRACVVVQLWLAAPRASRRSARREADHAHAEDEQDDQERRQRVDMERCPPAASCRPRR